MFGSDCFRGASCALRPITKALGFSISLSQISLMMCMRGRSARLVWAMARQQVI